MITIVVRFIPYFCTDFQKKSIFIEISGIQSKLSSRFIV
jgi:hypothetical protein